MSDAEVMLSTKIRSMTGQYVGLVNLVISGDAVSGILKEAMSYESDASFPFNMRSVFIVDDLNRVVSGEGLTPGAQIDPSLAAALTRAGTGRIQDGDTGRETLVFHANSRQSGFRVVSMVDYADFMRDINDLQQRIIWLVLGCELIAAAIWWLHTLSIKRPIGRIVGAMKHMEANRLDARVSDGGRDDLHYLSESFNAMAEQIQKLMDETKRIEASKREAEMQALEAQINPHFLYNTLDMISWMAYQSKTDEIRRTIGALSNFFRLSLNRGHRTYRVQDELDHVRAYLDIQQERLQARERFTWRIEADETARNMRMIKILLQPLVENAITHGLMKKEGKGSLVIGARVEEDRLLLYVEDDGIGLKKAALEQSGFHSSYGLRSVEERIRQYYGEGYSLKVTEREEGGVRALITLPAIEWEERQ
jgi:two-component system sensor histidine kinase YesM